MVQTNSPPNQVIRNKPCGYIKPGLCCWKNSFAQPGFDITCRKKNINPWLCCWNANVVIRNLPKKEHLLSLHRNRQASFFVFGLIRSKLNQLKTEFTELKLCAQLNLSEINHQFNRDVKWSAAEIESETMEQKQFRSPANR